MIKFFRKIRYDLMKENKTGKYLTYAIGEIILVVIGILIALYINNWNENNKFRDQAKVDLTTVSQNIEFDIIQAKSSLKLSNRIIDGLSELLDQFKTIKPADNRIQIYIALSQIETTRQANKSGINSLNESGGLSYIDANLKTKILSYYELIDIIVNREEISNSLIQNILEPYIKTKYNWIYNKTNPAPWISNDYKNDPRPIYENYSGLLSDRELEVHIWSRRNQEKKLKDHYLKLIETGEELINKIKSDKK